MQAEFVVENGIYRIEAWEWDSTCASLLGIPCRTMLFDCLCQTAIAPQVPALAILIGPWEVLLLPPANGQCELTQRPERPCHLPVYDMVAAQIDVHLSGPGYEWAAWGVGPAVVWALIQQCHAGEVAHVGR